MQSQNGTTADRHPRRLKCHTHCLAFPKILSALGSSAAIGNNRDFCSIAEVHYLLSKLKMKNVMTKRVVTVGDNCPLEEAARIMVDYKIGGLPILLLPAGISGTNTVLPRSFVDSRILSSRELFRESVPATPLFLFIPCLSRFICVLPVR